VKNKVSRRQRLHREPDPRVRRSLVQAAIAAVVLVAVGLGLVALRVHDVRLAYRVDALRAERARTERLLNQLEIEIATLSAPGRLASRARDLGLTAPARDQVQLAREYVTTGSGSAAAARVARTEAPVR